MAEYFFKYDKQNNLNTYTEEDARGVKSFYSLNNNRLISYDKNSKIKRLVCFSENCRMVQRFEASESWVSIIKNSVDEIFHDFPRKSNEVIAIGNNILSFYTSKKFLKHCISVIKSNNYK